MTEMEKFLRAYSASIGLNPDIVMRVVMSEGGASSLQPAGYARQSLVGAGGDQEQSYGPLQMNIRGGLGERALKAGIGDPRNPADAFKIAKYGLDVMKAEGLGHWHGWKGDKWAARMGTGSGEEVPLPGVASGRYDPRSDSPSYARPTGADVAGYADEHPVGPEGDTVTVNSPYNLPAPGTADNPLITQERTKNPFEKAGAAVAKLGDRSKQSTLGGIQNVPNPPLTSMPAISSIDPQSAANQRNALIAALMRVNSGQLWPMGGGGMGGGGIG